MSQQVAHDLLRRSIDDRGPDTRYVVVVQSPVPLKGAYIKYGGSAVGRINHRIAAKPAGSWPFMRQIDGPRRRKTVRAVDFVAPQARQVIAVLQSRICIHPVGGGSDDEVAVLLIGVVH